MDFVKKISKTQKKEFSEDLSFPPTPPPRLAVHVSIDGGLGCPSRDIRLCFKLKAKTHF